MTNLSILQNEIAASLQELGKGLRPEDIRALFMDGCWECRTMGYCLSHKLDIPPQVPQYMILTLLKQLPLSRHPERVHLGLEEGKLSGISLRFPWLESFIWLTPAQPLSEVWGDYRLSSSARKNYDTVARYSSDFSFPGFAVTHQEQVEGFARAMSHIHTAVAPNMSFTQFFERALMPASAVTTNIATIGYYDC